MQQNHSQVRPLEPAQPASTANYRANLFDRYRPAAIVALCNVRTYHVLLGVDGFPEMVAEALPDFTGDGADVVATLNESSVREAADDIDPISEDELDAAYPVLSKIAKTLELSFVERLIFAFLVQAQEGNFWRNWGEQLGAPVLSRAYFHLSAILKLKPYQVKLALDPGGRLVSSGLIEGKFGRVFGRVGILSRFLIYADLDVQMLKSHDAWAEFFRSQFKFSTPQRGEYDFSYLENDCCLFCDYLGNALYSKQKGIHILLYGPPGTGKTTLARDLASRLGTDLCEVRKEFKAETKSDGEARMAAYNLAQRLGVTQSQYLMLFDELEDVLPPRPWLHRGHSPHKGWICETLENATVPTMWTSNSLGGIDPAILRRFTFTMEVGIPPQSFRRKLLDRTLSGKKVSHSWLDRTAMLDCLTPAMTVQLGNLANSLSFRGQKLEAALDRWLEERLKAMRKPPLRPPNSTTSFRYDLMNADMDPEQLIKAMRSSGEGRLCLYGPPGTGKTAFARFLAKELDLEALVRRGSDIRSAYVGETEQNIARMFCEASRNRAVLILDEADSFLSSRSGRRHRWEMNEVSEFLIQLESFQGIFCATTNRFEDLDPAFIRRFDLKIKLDYLTAEQHSLMFKSLLKEFGLSSRLSGGTCVRLETLGSLTPGDFVTVQRRMRFSGQEWSQKALLSALVHEVECKNIHKGRPIGFRWAN